MKPKLRKPKPQAAPDQAPVTYVPVAGRPKPSRRGKKVEFSAPAKSVKKAPRVRKRSSHSAPPTQVETSGSKLRALKAQLDAMVGRVHKATNKVDRIAKESKAGESNKMVDDYTDEDEDPHLSDLDVVKVSELDEEEDDVWDQVP